MCQHIRYNKGHAPLQVASAPKEVAQKADIIFAMLLDPPAALQVATADDGVAAGDNITPAAVCSSVGLPMFVLLIVVLSAS